MTEQVDIPRVNHWSDITAERIIKQKGDKESYVLASGITPSGVVHFGNFREVITVDLVARALREKGKKVRFIFSWDDYDTFRKVPANLPKQELLQEYLFQPIVDTPDPFNEHTSYAAHHEDNFERQLQRVGIVVEPIYQNKKYRNSDYAQGISKALKSKEQLAEILNQHRTSKLPEDWFPVSVYCEKCNTDHKTKITNCDGNHVTYSCENCSYSGKEEVASSSRLKLPWRIDWPMRWAYEKVDFEPGGKDHSSQGGSYTTAKDIVKIYDWDAPIYLQYDFVSIKGAGGKMSSSKGNLVTVDDVLNIYEPEMVRWIFASYKTNVDFSVSFDLDVIKTYEDFDRQERLAYGVEKGNAKKAGMARRVFELSQVSEMPKTIPIQPSFRHLCNILQIYGGDIAMARSSYEDQIKTERDERRFNERSQCALFWLQNYAPEDFKFALNTDAPKVEFTHQQKSFAKLFAETIESEWNKFETDKDLHERMYELIHSLEMEPASAFSFLYQLLISKEKGPKLAGFIRTIGREKCLNLLKQVAS